MKIMTKDNRQRCLCEGQDYVIRTADFGSSAADGAVMSCEDGVANIYINIRVCPQRQRDALKHELDHIANDDLYSEAPIEEIEA